MSLKTNGFRPGKRQDHFKKHCVPLAVTTAEEYEERADAFLSAPIRPAEYHIHRCIRRGGDVVRYDERTGEFGVLTRDGYIRTYLKLDPSPKKRAENLKYFQSACAEVYP